MDHLEKMFSDIDNEVIDWEVELWKRTVGRYKPKKTYGATLRYANRYYKNTGRNLLMALND